MRPDTARGLPANLVAEVREPRARASSFRRDGRVNRFTRVGKMALPLTFGADDRLPTGTRAPRTGSATDRRSLALTLPHRRRTARVHPRRASDRVGLRRRRLLLPHQLVRRRPLLAPAA